MAGKYYENIKIDMDLLFMLLTLLCNLICNVLQLSHLDIVHTSNGSK
jgi:hypothetical protein